MCRLTQPPVPRDHEPSKFCGKPKQIQLEARYHAFNVLQGLLVLRVEGDCGQRMDKGLSAIAKKSKKRCQWRGLFSDTMRSKNDTFQASTKLVFRTVCHARQIFQ